MSRRRAAAAVLAALLALAGPARSAPGVNNSGAVSVTVERNQFQITLPDGRVLEQTRLPGVALTLGDGSGAQRRIRIDAVQHDQIDPSGETMLYALSEQDPSGAWQNACLPGPDGLRLGFPLPGAFTSDGKYQPGHPGILITCTGGAEGKCVRFGYKPWRINLLPYYQTCVRLVRADYGGDGVGHTRNGTPIDLFDRIGVQADEIAPGMTLEAAFGPEGAVCVAHTRLPNVFNLHELVTQYPRFAGHLGSDCSTDAPGLLFVRSYGL